MLVRKLLVRFSHFRFGSWVIHVSFFNCMADRSTDVTYKGKKMETERGRERERRREREKERDRSNVHIGSRVKHFNST